MLKQIRFFSRTDTLSKYLIVNLSSTISLIGYIRNSLQFPSIILLGVSGWRLEYTEYQNMLKLAEYHSKEIASNVSVDNVSVVQFFF